MTTATAILIAANGLRYALVLLVDTAVTALACWLIRRGWAPAPA